MDLKEDKIMTEEMKEILDTIQESYKQGYKDAVDKAHSDDTT